MFQPTQEIMKHLREGFSAEKCATALMDTAVLIASSFGVAVSYSIKDVEEGAEVDGDALTKGVNDLTAVMSAIMAGAKVNVLTMWEKKNVKKPKT